MARRPTSDLIPAAQLTRRAWIGTAAGCLVTGCASSTGWKPRHVQPTKDDVLTLALGDFPELVTPGGMVAVAPAGHRHPILIERLQGERFVVLSLRCPHLGCTVRWDEQEQRLRCPCHGSRFEDTGRVLQGPAKTGLAQYPHTFSTIDLELRIDLAHPRQG